MSRPKTPRQRAKRKSAVVSSELVSTKTIEPVYRSLGAKIEQLRTTLGWTQDELAEKVCLNRTSVTNIEAGRQRILLHDVDKFATAFNIQPKVLLRGIWC